MSQNPSIAVVPGATPTDAVTPWEVMIDHQRERSERLAWWVAGIASIIALAAVIGIATLAPYRRNVPYLLALDRSTGNVEALGALDDRAVKGYQEMLDKHWVQFYVIARESYFYKLLQQDYDSVLGFSGDDVGKIYARLYEGPDARDKKYGANTEIAVSVLSIQLAANNIGPQAVVRFSKTRRRVDNNASEPTEYFVATISYLYRPSMFAAEKEMIRNPLGFQVTGYRTDPELAPLDNGVKSTTPSNGG